MTTIIQATTKAHVNKLGPIQEKLKRWYSYILYKYMSIFIQTDVKKVMRALHITDARPDVPGTKVQRKFKGESTGGKGEHQAVVSHAAYTVQT